MMKPLSELRNFSTPFKKTSILTGLSAHVAPDNVVDTKATPMKAAAATLRVNVLKTGTPMLIEVQLNLAGKR